MIIRVINPSTKQYVEFMDDHDFKKSRGYPEPRNQQDANRQGVYAIKAYSGVQGLPANNNITNVGIGQDGDSFLSNHYSNRQIIIDYYSYDTMRLAQILYMNDQLLDVKVITNYGIYKTKGYVVGSYNGGSIELSCSPFYTVEGLQTQIRERGLHDEGDPFLPIAMPRVWFGNVTDQVTIPIDIGIKAMPEYEITGSFEGLTITNDIGNQILKYEDVVVGGKMNIKVGRNGNIETFVDGQVYRGKPKGLFVELLNGTNTLRFRFSERTTNIKVTVTYEEVTAYVI